MVEGERAVRAALAGRPAVDVDDGLGHTACAVDADHLAGHLHAALERAVEILLRELHRFLEPRVVGMKDDGAGRPLARIGHGVAAVRVGGGDVRGCALNDDRCAGEALSIRLDRAALRFGAGEDDRSRLVVALHVEGVGRVAGRVDAEGHDRLILGRLDAEVPVRVGGRRDQRRPVGCLRHQALAARGQRLRPVDRDFRGGDGLSVGVHDAAGDRGMEGKSRQRDEKGKQALGGAHMEASC